MTTKRKPAAPPEPFAALSLPDLADEASALGDDLAYALGELESAKVKLPPGLAVRVNDSLRRACADLDGFIGELDSLVPRPHKDGRSGHPAAGGGSFLRQQTKQARDAAHSDA